MSEKLTPKEAFEHLKAVFPWLGEIRRSNDVSIDGVYLCGVSDYPKLKTNSANIDWGETKSYKPEKWRPATIEDVKRALDNPIECRLLDGRSGVLVGGITNNAGRLLFSVNVRDFYENYATVEVRE